MTTCLILAAGEAERHNGGNKPLLKVNGETLLERTARLIEHRCQCPILVTQRQDLVDAMPSPDLSWFMPKEHRWIVETLLSTRHQWSDEGSTVVLLGDVYYTAHAIETIYSATRFSAFGNGCNIHALGWHSVSNSDIGRTLKKAVENAEAHPNSYGAGKLWTFLALCHYDVPVIDFGDETTDFDSPQEHQRFVAKYGNRSTTSKAD